jgi:hypothetical protein
MAVRTKHHSNIAITVHSDKGKSVAILQIQDYADRTDNIINETQFFKIHIDPTASLLTGRITLCYPHAVPFPSTANSS